MQKLWDKGKFKQFDKAFPDTKDVEGMCDGVASETITSGVPQGTITGPVDYLIYPNLTNNARLFADDSALYTAAKTKQDLQTLQDDLTKLEEWQNR